MKEEKNTGRVTKIKEDIFFISYKDSTLGEEVYAITHYENNEKKFCMRTLGDADSEVYADSEKEALKKLMKKIDENNIDRTPVSLKFARKNIGKVSY